MMMMMINNSDKPHTNLTVQAPPWDFPDDPTPTKASPFHLTSVNLNATVTSPNGDSAFAALSRYLPSNINNSVYDSDFPADDFDIPVDAFSCDQFRMYDFKVRKCARARSHDWTECPFAHPGEKARRRDPRKYHYSGTACPEFRKGLCKKGDSCEFAHGVFECWLHPARYRTQPCKDGTQCRRRICFFAHTPDQLRVLPQSDSYDGSPSRLGFDSHFNNGSLGFGSSPTSTLYSPPVSPRSDSPPMSPQGSLGVNSVSELAASIRTMQIGKMRMSPPSWGSQMGSGFCSPRSPSTLRPGFMSLPSTPNMTACRPGPGMMDVWEQSCEEEPVMERVESGRELRARIYAKLGKENSLGRVDSGGNGPDVGWISELVN